MEQPIFKTKQTNKLASVSIYPDRMEYSSSLTSSQGPQNIPLEEIQQTALLPKPPGADPRKIDVAVKMGGKEPLILKDLDIEDARNIQSTLKSQRLQKPKQVIEEHPFTQSGRVLKRLQEKQFGRQKVKPQSAPTKPLRLTFRRKV